MRKMPRVPNHLCEHVIVHSVLGTQIPPAAFDIGLPFRDTFHFFSSNVCEMLLNLFIFLQIFTHNKTFSGKKQLKVGECCIYDIYCCFYNHPLSPTLVTTLRPEIGKIMYDDHKQVG